MQSESISLYFQEGSSDKEYHVQLEPHEGGWTVNFQYGRRGSALQAGSKTPQPLPYADAKKIYDKVVREKIWAASLSKLGADALFALVPVLEWEAK